MSDKKPFFRKKINEEFLPCLVPDADYEVSMIMYGRSNYKGTPKLLTLWLIETECEFKGFMLPRYYNLSSWDKKTRTPIPTAGSDYAKDYRRFHNQPKTKRGYNPESYIGMIYVASVVKCESGGFSKIEKIVGEFK